MSILSLCVVIVVAGVLLWLAVTYIPMAAPIKTILTAVVAIFLVLLALQAFGVLGSIHGVRLR